MISSFFSPLGFRQGIKNQQLDSAFSFNWKRFWTINWRSDVLTLPVYLLKILGWKKCVDE